MCSKHLKANCIIRLQIFFFPLPTCVNIFSLLVFLCPRKLFAAYMLHEHLEMHWYSVPGHFTVTCWMLLWRVLKFLTHPRRMYNQEAENLVHELWVHCLIWFLGVHFLDKNYDRCGNQWLIWLEMFHIVQASVFNQYGLANLCHRCTLTQRLTQRHIIYNSIIDILATRIWKFGFCPYVLYPYLK